MHNDMEINKTSLIISLIIIYALYIIYRFISRQDKNLDKDINKILNSKEHKVKSQFD